VTRDASPSAIPSLEAPPAGATDVVVAQVDGRPVWGSCVAAQSAGHPERRQSALKECIALEVAAQEAERRGFDRDPDVVDHATRALAARFLDVELTAKIRSVADLPSDLVEPIFAKYAYRMHRPELRASFFARIELDKRELGTTTDRAAESAAHAAYNTLAHRTDLFSKDVEAELRATAVGMKVSTRTQGLASRDGLQPYYRDALFAVAEVGTVASPVRGPHGWDLILYTGQLPPLETSRDDILAQLFPALRLRYFDRWSMQLSKNHTRAILVDDDTLREALGGEPESPSPNDQPSPANAP
jgi:hypothetical protein